MARIEHDVALPVVARSDSLEHRFGHGLKWKDEVMPTGEQQQWHRNVASVIQCVRIWKSRHSAHSRRHQDGCFESCFYRKERHGNRGTVAQPKVSDSLNVDVSALGEDIEEPR